MHETGIVRDLIGKVETLAREAGAKRVSAVSVWLGALCQFSPAHFREHFDEEARRTLVEGAVLTILTSGDESDPHAQDVILRNVDLDIEEDEGS